MDRGIFKFGVAALIGVAIVSGLMFFATKAMAWTATAPYASTLKGTATEFTNTAVVEVLSLRVLPGKVGNKIFVGWEAQVHNTQPADQASARGWLTRQIADGPQEIIGHFSYESAGTAGNVGENPDKIKGNVPLVGHNLDDPETTEAVTYRMLAAGAAGAGDIVVSKARMFAFELD